MKLTVDANASVNLIRRYSASELVVGDVTLRSPCIVTADTIVPEWKFASIQCLMPDELTSILILEPDVILLGTGERQIFPAPSLISYCAARGVALEAMDLGAACRTFNVLVQENRRVAGAFAIRSEG